MFRIVIFDTLSNKLLTLFLTSIVKIFSIFVLAYTLLHSFVNRGEGQRI